MNRARIVTALGFAALVCAAVPASCAQLAFDPVKLASMAADKYRPAPEQGFARAAVVVPMARHAAAVKRPTDPAPFALAGILAALTALAGAVFTVLRVKPQAVAA